MSTPRKSSSKVLDTRYCGAPNATLMVVEGFVIPAVAVAPGKFDLGLSVEGVPGYRELCYLSMVDQSRILPVGSLELLGPKPQEAHCTLGLPCSVVLEGTALNEDNNVREASKCCKNQATASDSEFCRDLFYDLLDVLKRRSFPAS